MKHSEKDTPLLENVHLYTFPVWNGPQFPTSFWKLFPQGPVHFERLSWKDFSPPSLSLCSG